jgi:chemotaxis protein CheD
MITMNVGIGEFKFSSRPEEMLKTYGLGSCVAVTIYDTVQKIAGLLHVAYPESSVNLKKAEELPGYFVDTGLPLFLSAMKNSNIVRKNVRVNLVGGASIMDENERFNIGKRNVLAIKRVLWQAGLGVLKEDIGGTTCRTVSFAVGTGEIIISNGTKKWNL